MKKNITALLLCSSVMALSMGVPAKAEMGKYSISPSVEFIDGQGNVGLNSKFGIYNNFSLRPFVYFLTEGGTDFGTALTYELTPTKTGNASQLTPYVGGSVNVNNGTGQSITTASVVGGLDLDLADNLQFNAGVTVPLGSNSDRATSYTISAGVRF